MLIILTRGKMMEVDDDDFDMLNEYQWYAHKWVGTRTRRPEAQYMACSHVKGDNRKKINAHRLILGVTDPKVFVDHKDGNTLNNRRANLRVCTRQQNGANMKTVCGVIPYKGVCRLRKRFRAKMKVDGVDISLGVFATPVEAARAYNEAAVKYFGEFAHVNILMR